MNLIFNRSDGFTFKKYSYLKNGSYAHASNKAFKCHEKSLYFLEIQCLGAGTFSQALVSGSL